MFAGQETGKEIPNPAAHTLQTLEGPVHKPGDIANHRPALLLLLIVFFGVVNLKRRPGYIVKAARIIAGHPFEVMIDFGALDLVGITKRRGDSRHYQNQESKKRFHGFIIAANAKKNK